MKENILIGIGQLGEKLNTLTWGNDNLKYYFYEKKDLLSVISSIKSKINRVEKIIIVSHTYRDKDINLLQNISCEARKLNIATILVTVIPFSFEGQSKREMYNKNILYIASIFDVVIPIASDFVFCVFPPTITIDKAFKTIETEITKLVVCINEVISFDNKYPAINQVLKDSSAICGFGFGEISKNLKGNQPNYILNKVLESPLLGGLQQLKKADTIFLLLTGTQYLTTHKIDETIQLFKTFLSSNTKIYITTNQKAAKSAVIQLKILTIINC